MKRIIVHWTAGAGRASELDRSHYHVLIERDGSVVRGKRNPADNIVTSDGVYAAHTLNLNTGSIGVAMCGMRGAVESPFDPGPSPLTEEQFEACAVEVANLCSQYGIAVTRSTVLTHAEVEGTLGVAQRGKWDITRLPFRPEIVGPTAVGDYLREKVRAKAADLLDDGIAQVLRQGSRGTAVMEVQEMLADLGLDVGAIDGLFGSRTRAAVAKFQVDHPPLQVDGVVGPITFNALDREHSKWFAPADAAPAQEPAAPVMPTVKYGNQGATVGHLQANLSTRGYFSGRLDGIFGALTRAAVLAFQADNRLATDGIVGPKTWDALETADARPQRLVSMAELEQSSGTVQDALMVARAGDVVGLGGVLALVSHASEAIDRAGEMSGVLETVAAKVAEDPQLAMLALISVVGWFVLRAISYRTRQRRLRDAREMRSLAR